MKRLIAFLLVIATLTLCVGCDTQETEAPTEASESSSETSTKENKILKSNLSEYVFVIGKDADASILRAAKGVSRIAKEKWKTDGTVNTDDYKKAAEAPFEVLVGETDRPESVEYIASLKEGEGGYAVIGSKLVIAGYSKYETISALNIFFNDVMMALRAANSTYMTEERNFKDDLSSHVSIMSFNVFVNAIKDSARAANVLKIIKAYNPDLLGVQEANADWQVKLKSELKEEYDIIGTGRDGGTTEATQIFIRKGKFTVEKSGTKWLSLTPDSISAVDGSQCTRIVTYAQLKMNNGKIINFANTHLDHTSDESVRVLQVGHLQNILSKELSMNDPTFITGDFNMTPSGSGYAKMKVLGYIPSSDLAKKNYSRSQNTFSGGGIIDYCFILNSDLLQTLSYRVCNESVYGNHSDHYPLYTTVKC